MKKLFNIKPGAGAVDLALLIARIGVGFLMLTHGWPKLMQLFGDEPIQFVGMMGMSPEMTLVMAVLAEVVCSLFIIIGLGTRLAVLPLIVTMLMAALVFHAADPFSAQELGLLYLMVYIVLFLLGSGRYSVDALIAGKKR